MLERLEASGLTGMGGAGFPTWRKWDAVRSEPGPRIVIVNADEGEPGTIKDRYVMELRPQLLLEGLVAAMRFCETDRPTSTSARSTAPLARVLQEAIAARGLPVELVDRRRRVHLRRGDGDARVDGRAARDAAAEAAVPEPRSGYLGRPTLINNVETLAHVALILRGDWERRRDSGRSPAPSRSRAATRRRSTSRSAA